MTIENEHVELENNDEGLELDLDLDDKDEDKDDSKGDDDKDDKKSDIKPKETPEQRVARLRRQLSREEKKLGKSEEIPKEKATKSSELDYGQKAFLVASGVKGSKEMKLVAEFMENTGKSLEDIVENKFFQAELKELRESEASTKAVPKGSKRSSQSTPDSVDYWLAKDALPENTPENQELRRKVVAAKRERANNTNKFAGNSTGGITRQSQLK